MSRKDNFRRAAYDMFGVGGKGLEEQENSLNAGEAAEEDVAALAGAFVDSVQQEERKSAPPPAPQYPTTVLAAGSVFEGTLRAKGSVDLACQFKGNIFAEGDVVMRTSLEGNVQGKCVELIACSVQGDIQAAEQLRVQHGSIIKGNIATRDLVCSGKVNGDVTAAGHVTLESTAQLTGNLTARTLSIEEGASIEGNVKVVRNQGGGKAD